MLVRLAHQILWGPLRLLFWLFADFKSSGLGRIAGASSPAIFVANHRSHFDPFLVGIALPWRLPFHGIHWLTNDAQFKRPIRQHTLRLLGAFPGNIHRAYSDILRRPMAELEQGRSVGVFPEWCYEGDLAALERMAHVVPLLAERTRRPVIPVFLSGIERAAWGRLFRRRLRIHITFGAPYRPGDAEPSDEIATAVNRLLLETRMRHLGVIHEEERRFWEDYGAFYGYLERADAYRDLLGAVARLLPEQISGAWVDLGSGSGAVVELLSGRSAPGARITATDHAAAMHEQLKARFPTGVGIQPLDLSEAFPFPPSSLDGITANLVLPYVIHYRGVTGDAALEQLLAELAASLKPGGTIIWSTPRENVKFVMAFLRSLPAVLRRDQRENLAYGPKILAQALQIQAKGRRGVYHFWDQTRIEAVMRRIGFDDVEITSAMAGQVYLVRGVKAAPIPQAAGANTPALLSNPRRTLARETLDELMTN